jgi:hypothetical protein
MPAEECPDSPNCSYAETGDERQSDGASRECVPAPALEHGHQSNQEEEDRDGSDEFHQHEKSSNQQKLYRHGIRGKGRESQE